MIITLEMWPQVAENASPLEDRAHDKLVEKLLPLIDKIRTLRRPVFRLRPTRLHVHHTKEVLKSPHVKQFSILVREQSGFIILT